MSKGELTEAEKITNLKNEIDKISRDIVGIETNINKLEDEDGDPITIANFYDEITKLEVKKDKLTEELYNIENGD